jgi:hypothetical protein
MKITKALVIEELHGIELLVAVSDERNKVIVPCSVFVPWLLNPNCARGSLPLPRRRPLLHLFRRTGSGLGKIATRQRCTVGSVLAT